MAEKCKDPGTIIDIATGICKKVWDGKQQQDQAAAARQQQQAIAPLVAERRAADARQAQQRAERLKQPQQPQPQTGLAGKFAQAPFAQHRFKMPQRPTAGGR